MHPKAYKIIYNFCIYDFRINSFRYFWNSDFSHSTSKKKKKLADKILPQKVRDLVPESQAYMDLLAFERKLDATIMRKRLDIQEALKRPMKQKRKLRIFISNTFYPAKEAGEGEEGSVASWELRVEGRLLDDTKNDPNKVECYFKIIILVLMVYHLMFKVIFHKYIQR